MTCPTCKSVYEAEVETCAKCGFPFSGTESQKSSFIAQQILKVGKIDDARSSVKTAKQVLFGIGGLNVLMAILNPAYLILGLVVGVSFVVFGFVVERSPFLFLLIALSALLLLYLTAALINPLCAIFFKKRLTLDRASLQ